VTSEENEGHFFSVIGFGITRLEFDSEKKLTALLEKLLVD
jgi:hypothetical protein